MSVANQFGPGLIYQELATTNKFYCGTEYEIESVKKLLTIEGIVDIFYDESYWYDVGDTHSDTVVIGALRDHSLRNNGVEFLTKPITFDKALDTFTTLQKHLTLGENPWSYRTSTHVHVNVASLSLDQLKHLVLLYALLEPVFWKYAGEKRKLNIHCVPLSFTLLPSQYNKSIGGLIGHWSKYSAFNLKPVLNQGTVEFRHLGGCGDFNTYKEWLSLLKDLWEFVYNKPPHWLEQMIKDGASPESIQAQVLPTSMGVAKNLNFEDSLLDVKLSFIGS